MPVDLSELDVLEGNDPDLEALRRAAKAVHDKGLDVIVERGKVMPALRHTDVEYVLDIGKERVKFAVISDTHLGSKHEQLSSLHEFYRYADTHKVDAFLHCGDLMQGSDKMHREAAYNNHAHGSDEQVEYAIRTYPQSKRKGVQTYVITGNHDDSFVGDAGTNVVRQVALRRPDFTYVGERSAFLTVGNVRMLMIHPGRGGAYAKSYKPQKIAEKLPLERETTLALIGHYHQYGQFLEKRTHVVMLPCFQSQYGWMAENSMYPDLGGLILDLRLDSNGRIAEMTTTLKSFPRRENDWDHEASAAVSRAWSPTGDVAA